MALRPHRPPNHPTLVIAEDVADDAKVLIASNVYSSSGQTVDQASRQPRLRPNCAPKLLNVRSGQPHSQHVRTAVIMTQPGELAASQQTTSQAHSSQIGLIIDASATCIKNPFNAHSCKGKSQTVSGIVRALADGRWATAGIRMTCGA